MSKHATNGMQINLYEPAILIVGTRGRNMGGFQGLLPGSVSKYCLQHSPVPVIVVRPNAKREKKKRKRQGDPGRYSYRAMLERSGVQSGQTHGQMLDVTAEDTPEASESEATAVANAIGFDPSADAANSGIGAGGIGIGPMRQRTRKSHSPLRNYLNSRSSGEESSPDNVKSPGPMMKSPSLRGIDSPLESEVSSDEREGGDDDLGVGQHDFEAVSGHDLLAANRTLGDISEVSVIAEGGKPRQRLP